MKETGVVKFFDDQNGWGFITRDDDDTEAFVHYSDIAVEGRGRRTLTQGQRVEFTLENGPRGYAAKDVVIIG
jgi:cold shock protein